MALARAELAERPGAALAHLAFVDRGGELGPGERALLAELYARRFQERLALGDGDAYLDVEAARALDPDSTPPPELAEGYFAAALAEYRRGPPWGNEDGDRLLARAMALAPDDHRGALLDLEELAPAGVRAGQGGAPAGAGTAVEAVGAAALWLHRGGARRAALAATSAYTRAGGHEPGVVQAGVLAQAWWSGYEVDLGLLEARALTAAGVNLCPLARTPDAFGCEDSVGAAAEAALVDPEDAAAGALAGEIWRVAELGYWRTRAPDRAEAWTVLALHAWESGQGDTWEELVRARVDVEQVLATGVSGPVAATLRRVAGQPELAARTLDEVLAGLAGAPPWARAGAGLTPGQQALVLAEAVAQRRPPEMIDALAVVLADAGGSGRRSAWWAQAITPHSAEDAPPAVPSEAERWCRMGALGPSTWAPAGSGQEAAEVASRAYALRWWHGLTARDPRLVAARDRLWEQWQGRRPAPSGWTARPATVPAAALVSGRDAEAAVALAEVAEAYVREPAVADRLARELVARRVSMGYHGPAVARLFAALGDPGRALLWWERVAEESPHHPDYLLALGVATAAAGDSKRAQLHLLAAAARSGDPGATDLDAAGYLLRQGLALDALTPARRALAHIAPGRRGPVLALLATALDSLGRVREAAAMRAAWLDQVAPAFRPRARAAMIAAAGADADPSRGRGAATVGDRRALASASAAPGTQAQADAAVGLLAAALCAPPEEAHAAFGLVSEALTDLGAEAEARQVRAARRAVEALRPPLIPATPP
ncbi:hypothetical protein [Haliangium sp.]|uniref:hypothetical protein n=1 Tax=Haliangium sp. TaxID=2663208 RepID=UPI003D11BE22